MLSAVGVQLAREPAADLGVCPLCEAALVERHSPRGVFLGCTNYPHCRYTRDPTLRVHNAPCPHCGGDLLYKHGKRGPFLGCANYPKCQHTQAIANENEKVIP